MKKFILLSATLFLLLNAKHLSAQFENIPTLMTKGEASIFKPSDQMEVSLGVVTAAENSSLALNENNQKMHQIITNLQELGLTESDFQTGSFHIRPIYQKTKNSQEDEHPVISGYEVFNAIQIKTQKIDLADKILSIAVQAGANQINQINFNLSNPQAYRAEAIKLATQNAIADAKALAGAAGVKLSEVLKLSLDQWHNFPGPVMLARGAESYSKLAEGETPPLEPGKAEIHAVVNVTFQITHL